MSGLGQPELQQQTLRFFGELMVLQPSWASRLILGSGTGCSACGFPAACSLAGAASLLLEPSMAEAKAALRDGGIDFLISTVDEALRTLKNEIRTGRPLAVALVCDVDAAMAELVERGVHPDLLFSATPQQPAAIGAGGWGEIRTLDLQAKTGALDRYLGERGLGPCTWPLPGRAAVRTLDAALLAIVPQDDSIRRRWIEGIARYQRSAAQDYRTAWVTAEERERIRAALDAQAS